MYELYFTRESKGDFKKIDKSHLKDEIYKLLDVIRSDPFQSPPPFKKLVGIYKGAYSRRINLQHRMFYTVDKESKKVKVIRMWGHYDDN